jgi:hypothetical protein
MKASGLRKIRIAITVSLLLLFLFANIISIRQLMRYGLELYFYDKMLVAYQIGGINGLTQELEMVLSQDKMPREIRLAQAFKENLRNLQSPDKFLEGIIKEDKKQIDLFRRLRNGAFGIILAIVLLRFALNLIIKPED